MLSQILQIRTAGDPILKKVAGQVVFMGGEDKRGGLVTSNIDQIVADLKATCAENKLIGLAATQIGYSFRVLVVHIHPTPLRPWLINTQPVVMVNPVILDPETPFIPKMVSDWEGCGSLPNIFAQVRRPEEVCVRWTNPETLKFETKLLAGLTARVAQHEIDHLNGILFIERADPETIMVTEHYLKLIKTKKRQLIRTQKKK